MSIKYVKLEDVLEPLMGSDVSGYKAAYLRNYYENLPTIEIEEEKELPELNWKPYYPNNMEVNGIDGYYCIVRIGEYSARKYTIKFEYEEENIETGLINPDIIERYVLFEKTYWDVKGPFKYPEPVKPDEISANINDTYGYCDTFKGQDYNDFGNYVRSYNYLDEAKQRVYTQLRAIDWAKSFM